MGRRSLPPAVVIVAGELRRAIEDGELVLHYQPQVDLADGSVVGVEALVRWDHPLHGLLPPDRFVPLAERGDLIRMLTESVVELALADHSRLRQAGFDLGVSVNLSVRNLHGHGLPNMVGRLLHRYGVPPEKLTLEITETMILADPARAGLALRSLRSLGVRISIDDFGTGYSSLAVLRGLPVQELKIDRSFVAAAASSHDDLAIVTFSTELGHRLGLRVVAEGIEDDRTRQTLRSVGCDLGQGFGIAPPLPADGLVVWLSARAEETAVGPVASAATRTGSTL